MKDDGDDEAVSQSKPRMDFMFDWDINAMILLCEFGCAMRCYSNAGIFLPSSSPLLPSKMSMFVRMYVPGEGGRPAFRPFLTLWGM